MASSPDGAPPHRTMIWIVRIVAAAALIVGVVLLVQRALDVGMVDPTGAALLLVGLIALVLARRPRVV